MNRGRVMIVTAVASVVTFVSVAIGGVPLIVGLGLLAAICVALLPAESRRYFLRRILRVVATVVTTMAIVWLLVHNYPDASRTTPAGVIPAMSRYGEWLGDLVLGNLGGNTSYSETVGEGLGRTVPISTQLVVYSQILAVITAVPAAIIGSRFRGRLIDVGFRGVALGGLAVPIFVTGPLLMFALGVGDIDIFGWSFGAKLFPTGRYIAFGEDPWQHARSMALPTITLGLTMAASYLVLLRSEIIQQLPLDHVLLARSKGVGPLRIIRTHALRPAAPSVVAAVGAQTSLLFGYLLIVERIFLLPGFGDYILVAIGRRDDIAVVGSLFVIAAILAVINLFADALLMVIDPRLDP
jgi:peptide/nickel transport system permease protein